MEKSFVSLLSAICAIRLNWLRINDVTTANGVLMLSFFDVKDAAGKDEVRLCLKDSNGKEYALTVRQLAALRIEVGEMKAIWLDEFNTDPACATFQSIARGYVDQGISLESLKFTVTKQLKVKNNQITDSIQPVYQDVCYSGAAEYKKGITALLKGRDNSFYQTVEYSRGMNELRDALHKTALRTGKGTEADQVLLPVFKIS